MLKKLGKFLYEKEMSEIRSIVEYLHFKVVSVFSVIPWFIIILDKRNSIFYPINSKENFWNSIMLLVFLLVVNMIWYIIVGHFLLKYIEQIKMQPKKEGKTSWKKIWENNQDIDVELLFEKMIDGGCFFVHVGEVYKKLYNSHSCRSLFNIVRRSNRSNLTCCNIYIEQMTFLKNEQKKIFSYKLKNGEETTELPLRLDIEISDFIEKENLLSDDLWENCKDLLSCEIVSLELGKTTLESNILGYVVQSEHYELRGVLRVFEKDDKAKEDLLTLQEQFKDQNQTLLELTEFEQSIKD
jgi:hypothetical protein